MSAEKVSSNVTEAHSGGGFGTPGPPVGIDGAQTTPAEPGDEADESGGTPVDHLGAAAHDVVCVHDSIVATLPPVPTAPPGGEPDTHPRSRTSVTGEAMRCIL